LKTAVETQHSPENDASTSTSSSLSVLWEREKWPIWFNKLGENLVDIGSPIHDGFVLHSDGSKGNSATNFNGYSIIQAKNINAVKNLVKDHPFLALGNGEYSVEIFELAR
jgi:hypothetical protein